MIQRTVTTMVEVMKNATMPWFSKQEKTTKDKIIDMARKKNKTCTKKIQRTGRSTKGRQEAKEKGRRERHADVAA